MSHHAISTRMPQSEPSYDKPLRHDQSPTCQFLSSSSVACMATPSKRIDALFAGFHGEYRPHEIDWGEPVGKEVW